MSVTMCLFIFDALIDKINNLETLIVREGVLEIMKELINEKSYENLEIYSA